MKISIILPDLGGGGAERLSVHLANDWAARGHAVEFALMRGKGALLPLLSPAITTVDLCAPRARHVVPALTRYLRAKRPDVVLAAMWPLTIAAIVAQRLAGGHGRVIVSDHAPLSRMAETQGWRKRAAARLSIALGYPLAHARVTVSSGVADDLARLGGLDRSAIAVIYNPAARGTLGTSHDDVDPWPPLHGARVIAVGALKPEKDHAALIRAFAVMRKRRSACLVILGEGKLRPALEGLIAELGLGDDVKLPGFALDPYPWYLRADLFVLSSQFEGFGNVLVEALECGLPVVATDCDYGPREILDRGKYGSLVPLGDTDALANAMSAALNQPRMPERQKSRAAEFSIERASLAYLNLFESRSRTI